MVNFENKKKLVTVAISCAIFFTVFYLITNVDAVSTFFSSILNVVSPIIIGAAIAYILNPLLKIFEFKVFKKMKRKALPHTFSRAHIRGSDTRIGCSALPYHPSARDKHQ